MAPPPQSSDAATSPTAALTAADGSAGTASEPKESGAWKAFRRARWTLAFLIVAGALSLSSYWIATDERPVCDVTTISGSAINETTKSCTLPNVTDYIYVVAVVGVLLLPEAKRIKIGGLEFERLTNEVKRQSDEISRLNQQVTTIAHNSQILNLAIHAVGMVSEAAQGDVAEGSQRREEVLSEFLDPGTGQPVPGATD